MENLETLDQIEVLFSDEEKDPTLAVAGVILAGTALVAVAAWKSGYGRRLRNMIAEVIKAD